MKKVIRSFLCFCLIVPMLLVPKSIEAKENTGEFVFTKEVYDTRKEHKVIPNNELWYLSEKAEIQGSITLPFMNDENVQEYEIVGITTNKPNVIQNLQVETEFMDDYSTSGKYVNFSAYAVEEEAFTLTLTLKKGEEVIQITSDEKIAKHKELELFVRRESTDITEPEDLFDKDVDSILKEDIADSFQLHHVYYVYAKIGGYDYSEVQSNLDYYVNGKPVYAGMRQDNDIFASYGLYYNSKDMRAGWHMPITAISVLAKQEAMLSIQVGKTYEYSSELDFRKEPKDIFFSNHKEMKDETGNVHIYAQAGVLPGNAELAVKDVTKDETIAKAMQDVQSYAAYDISLLSNGAAIQPNGKVSVRIKIPAGMNKDALDVYYVDANGKRTLLESYLLNGEIIFETDHFSTYVVAERKQQDSGNEEIKDAVTGEEDATDDPMKNTSAQIDTKSVQMVMMSIIIGCGLCFVRKKVKD